MCCLSVTQASAFAESRFSSIAMEILYREPGADDDVVPNVGLVPGCRFRALPEPSFSRLARPKDLRQLLRRIYNNVRDRILQSVRSEPIGHAHRPQPGVATSADIDM